MADSNEAPATMCPALRSDAGKRADGTVDPVASGCKKKVDLYCSAESITQNFRQSLPKRIRRGRA